jgi:hypothetical protein
MPKLFTSAWNVGFSPLLSTRFLFTYKLQERRRFHHQDFKVPVHLQITRTSAFTLPRLQGSCSPTNYKNVGIFATTTSRASLQAIKFIFTIEKIGAFATKKAFAFPVFQVTSSSIFPKDVFLKSLLRLFRMGAIDCLFSKLKSILRLFRMGKLDCLFSKPLQVTYIVKAAAPVQKSCKGNTVEAQLNNRSRGAMLKVLKRQHRDAQVAHKCVSPPPISQGGVFICFIFYCSIFYICSLVRSLWADLEPVIHMIFYITFSHICCSTMLLS